MVEVYKKAQEEYNDRIETTKYKHYGNEHFVKGFTEANGDQPRIPSYNPSSLTTIQAAELSANKSKGKLIKKPEEVEQYRKKF